MPEPVTNSRTAAPTMASSAPARCRVRAPGNAASAPKKQARAQASALTCPAPRVAGSTSARE